MNGKKRVTALLFVVCIAALLLAGCGGSKCVGSWKAVSMEGSGIEMSMEGQDYSLEINKDGTAALTDNGVTVQMTWEETDDGIVLSSEDAGLQLSGTMDGGELILDYAGFNMHFKK